MPPLRARGARLVAVSDVRAVLRRAQTKLVLALGVPEWLSPLTAVVPGQVAALALVVEQAMPVAKADLTRDAMHG